MSAITARMIIYFINVFIARFLKFFTATSSSISGAVIIDGANEANEFIIRKMIKENINFFSVPRYFKSMLKVFFISLGFEKFFMTSLPPNLLNDFVSGK